MLLDSLPQKFLTTPWGKAVTSRIERQDLFTDIFPHVSNHLPSDDSFSGKYQADLEIAAISSPKEGKKPSTPSPPRFSFSGIHLILVRLNLTPAEAQR
jgi:hypothetical protein